jgi:hypothetical protein
MQLHTEVENNYLYNKWIQLRKELIEKFELKDIKK